MRANRKLFISPQKMPKEVYEKEVLGFGQLQNPHVPFYIYTPVVIVLFYLCFFKLEIHFIFFLKYFIGAMIFWTLLEYTMHRYLFHFEAKSGFGKKFIYSIHAGHHDYPNDDRFMLVGPIYSISAFILFYLVFYLVLGSPGVHAFMLTITAYYMVYDWIHYAVHHYNYKNPLFQKFKQHHMNHHYLDNEKNFGFTTTIWDVLMNTQIDSSSKSYKK